MATKKILSPSPKKPSSLAWLLGVGGVVAVVAVAMIVGRQITQPKSTVVPLPTGIGVEHPILAPSPTSTPSNIHPPIVVKPTASARPTTVAKPTPDDNLPPPSDQDAAVSGFILDFSNARKVTNADLAGLSPWELKVARNEIYARYGRAFVHKDLSCYFAQQDWYTVDPAFTTSQLSALESSNATFILNFEKNSQSPLVNKDSGCHR